MVHTLDTGVNLILNLAGFTGLGSPHQLLIAIVLGTAAVLWNAASLPRFVVGSFMALVFLLTGVALYAIFMGRQPACIYGYDTSKPVFTDSLQRNLSWKDVRPLDCASLWVARNEIYLRSNYCFFTPTANAYFGGNETCDPEVEMASTDIGNRNATLISRMERRKSCRAVGNSCQRLGRAFSSKLILNRETRKIEN